jgi:transposase-like protein
LSQPYLQALIEIELPDLMPTYDDKRQAVDVVAPSIYSIGSAAKELGLRDSVLRRWVEPRRAGREPSADHAPVFTERTSGCVKSAVF